MQEQKGLGVTPVIQMGDIEEKDIAGYYVIFFKQPPGTTSRLDRSNLIPLPIVLFLQNNNLTHVPATELHQKLGLYQEFHKLQLFDKFYIFPHTKNEQTADVVKKRVLDSNKKTKIGYFTSGKLMWGEKQPESLALEYSTESTILADAWKKMLRGSPFLRFVTLYDSRPISTPRELVMCEFIPESVALTPEQLVYKKANGKFKNITTVNLAKKISRKRGFRWEYTNQIFGPEFLGDHLFNGKFRQASVSFPCSDEDFFLDPALDLAGHELPESVTKYDDTLMRRMSGMHEFIAVHKSLGLDGFEVISRKKIQATCPIGWYAGDFCDVMFPRDRAFRDAFLTSTIEGVLPFSWNQAFFSFRRGNYIGLINHAPEEQCNVGVTYGNYNGFLFLVYYALKDIDPLMPLLVNYSNSRTKADRVYPEQDSNLLFKPKGGIVFDNAARATAKVVNKEGMDYFKAGNFTAAKRQFKQAVGLTENAPDNDVDKVACLYNLASAYFMLSGQSKKYVERAREWLIKAQQFPTHAEKASEKLKILADPYSVIPICQLGNLTQQDTAGYYLFYFVNTVSDDHVQMSKMLLPGTALLTQTLPSPGAPADALIQKLESVDLAQPEVKKTTRVYILPHKKNETIELAQARLSRASHQSKIKKFGFLHGGKITWMGMPMPLDAKYTRAVEMNQAEWKAMLLASPLSQLLAEYGAHAVSTPQEMNFCNLFPPHLVSIPTEIVYRKGNGTLVKLKMDRFSEKVSRSRGIEWTFTNGISIPQLLRDFIDRNLDKKFVSLPGRGNEFGVDAAQDLSLACKFPEGIKPLTDEQIQRITHQSKIGIQKITAFGGFGAVAAEFIKAGEIVVFYAGEVTDFIAPIKKSIEHSMHLCGEDGKRVRDNLSVRSYRRGNYAGFVNHSNDASQHNIRANARMYNGCIVVIYEATRDIPEGAPLLMDYLDAFGKENICLSFTASGGIVFDDAAKKMATAVYKQGVEFFTAGKLPEAKRAFKQAVGLIENAPAANLEKAQFQRSLGTTYFKLIDSKEVRDKTKYTSRARFFLEAAQKHPKYAADTEVERKLEALKK